ncbi:hypothetical protein AVEN_247995-1 [Araneus ventricosus]|uniref:Uncharacterized protein n=1 Tax=Araneus ventricosus TaxID=182803 RepID=A0A4Y2WYG6_ARAVE|nr:hypothetical protein AVEN_247995-1 [Araneus ventricosus]
MTTSGFEQDKKKNNKITLKASNHLTRSYLLPRNLDRRKDLTLLQQMFIVFPKKGFSLGTPKTRCLQDPHPSTRRPYLPNLASQMFVKCSESSTTCAIYSAGDVLKLEVAHFSI